jgi:membrane-associated phospholipid phosphatase
MHLGYFSFYLIVFGLIFYIYLNNEKDGMKVLALIMISFLSYYLIFIFLPVKGPQFYFSSEELNLTGHGFFYELVHLAQEIGETETGAFPSSHVGVSYISLVLSYRYARKIFPVILVLCLLLWPATVYIQAHYLVDVIAGFISAPFILRFACFSERKLSAQQII